MSKHEMFDKLKALNRESFYYIERLDTAKDNACELARELKKQYKDEELTESERNAIGVAYSPEEAYREMIDNWPEIT